MHLSAAAAAMPRSPLMRQDHALQMDGDFYLDPFYQPKQFYGLNDDKPDQVHSLENVCPRLELDADVHKRVLVLYTGGTIGMKIVDGGERARVCLRQILFVTRSCWWTLIHVDLQDELIQYTVKRFGISILG